MTESVGVLPIVSELSIKHFRPKGQFHKERFWERWAHKYGLDDRERHGIFIYDDGAYVDDYGVVCRRVVTDAGVAKLVDSFRNLFEPENFNYHAFGTGTTAEAAGDTALVTEVETRATGVQSGPAANQYRTVGTVSFTATRTVGEHGVFSQLAAGGTLWDRSLVTPTVGVNNGDAIEATYTLTINSGG